MELPLEGPWEELGALPSKEQELAPEADSNFCTGKPHSLGISTGCREMGLEQKTGCGSGKALLLQLMSSPHRNIPTEPGKLDSEQTAYRIYVRCFNSVYFSQLLR